MCHRQSSYRQEKTKGNELSQRGPEVIEELSVESRAIVETFEKALNVCFGKYLEAQRKWVETRAVRDLEFEGDKPSRDCHRGM